jgi:hypothetical protein
MVQSESGLEKNWPYRRAQKSTARRFRFSLDLVGRGVLTNHLVPPNDREICLADIVSLRFAILDRQLNR